MGRQVAADGVDAVFLEQDPVELALYFFMRDVPAGGKVVDILVAGAVQGKVTEKTAQVAVIGFATVSGEECFAGLREKISAGQAVHASPFRVQRVVREGLVVEEKIGAMQADREQVLFLQEERPVFGGQRF